MSKPTGGGAFPFEFVSERISGLTTSWSNHKGMTLRQYYAGQALIGTTNALCINLREQESLSEREVNRIATNCIRIADAMLKAGEE